MAPIAKGLSPEDTLDVATYYARLEAPFPCWPHPFAGNLKAREIEALAAYYQQARSYTVAGQPKN
jgi:cytochrome c553